MEPEDASGTRKRRATCDFCGKRVVKQLNHKKAACVLRKAQDIPAGDRLTSMWKRGHKTDCGCDACSGLKSIIEQQRSSKSRSPFGARKRGYLRLTDDQDRRLRVVARLRHIGLGEACLHAVEQYLAREELDLQTRR